jgi:hypothetical protein
MLNGRRSTSYHCSNAREEAYRSKTQNTHFRYPGHGQEKFSGEEGATCGEQSRCAWIAIEAREGRLARNGGLASNSGLAGNGGLAGKSRFTKGTRCQVRGARATKTEAVCGLAAERADDLA